MADAPGAVENILDDSSSECYKFQWRKKEEKAKRVSRRGNSTQAGSANDSDNLAEFKLQKRDLYLEKSAGIVDSKPTIQKLADLLNMD